MTLKKSLGFPGLVSLPETDAHTRPPPFLRRAALLLLGLGGSCSPRPRPLPAPAPRHGDTGVGLGSVSHTPVLLPSLCSGGSATVPRPENPRPPGQLWPRCLPPVPSGAPPVAEAPLLVPGPCHWAPRTATPSGQAHPRGTFAVEVASRGPHAAGLVCGPARSGSVSRLLTAALRRWRVSTRPDGRRPRLSGFPLLPRPCFSV